MLSYNILIKMGLIAGLGVSTLVACDVNNIKPDNQLATTAMTPKAIKVTDKPSTSIESPKAIKVVHKEPSKTQTMPASDGLLISFKSEVSKETVEQLVSQHHAKVKRRLGEGLGMNLYHVSMPTGLNTEQAIRLFSKLPEVKYAEPNARVTIAAR